MWCAGSISQSLLLSSQLSCLLQQRLQCFRCRRRRLLMCALARHVAPRRCLSARSVKCVVIISTIHGQLIMWVTQRRLRISNGSAGAPACMPVCVNVYNMCDLRKVPPAGRPCANHCCPHPCAFALRSWHRRSMQCSAMAIRAHTTCALAPPAPCAAMLRPRTLAAAVSAASIAACSPAAPAALIAGAGKGRAVCQRWQAAPQRQSHGGGCSRLARAAAAAATEHDRLAEGEGCWVETRGAHAACHSCDARAGSLLAG
jgi:hypothetical protein